MIRVPDDANFSMTVGWVNDIKLNLFCVNERRKGCTKYVEERLNHSHSSWPLVGRGGVAALCFGEFL